MSDEVKLPRNIMEAILCDELAHTVVGRQAAEQLHGIVNNPGTAAMEKSLQAGADLRRAVAAALLRAEANGADACLVTDSDKLRAQADALDKERG